MSFQQFFGFTTFALWVLMIARLPRTPVKMAGVLCHDRNTNRMLRGEWSFRGPAGAASIDSLGRGSGADGSRFALRLRGRRLRREPSLVCQAVPVCQPKGRLYFFRASGIKTAAAADYRERSRQ